MGGYRLAVRFTGDLDAEVTLITMSVELAPDVDLEPCAVAWFCLHPTFPWRWVKVRFGDRRATFSVMAWGGFTVGVWLPEAGIELERDLATIPDAPDVIKLR